MAGRIGPLYAVACTLIRNLEENRHEQCTRQSGGISLVTCPFRVRVVAQLEFLHLGHVGKLSGERGCGVRIDYLQYRHIDRVKRIMDTTIDLTFNVCNAVNP